MRQFGSEGRAVLSNSEQTSGELFDGAATPTATSETRCAAQRRIGRWMPKRTQCQADGCALAVITDNREDPVSGVCRSTITSPNVSPTRHSFASLPRSVVRIA